MATIREIKGNVRFAIECATKEGYQPLAEFVGEEEAEWMGEALRKEFVKKGLNEGECAYVANKRDEWFDNKAEELINDYKILTYDVVFDDDESSASKGFEQTFDECKAYIERYNGADGYYFEDFKSGVVSIRCNETDEDVYHEDIKNNDEDEDEPKEMHLKDFGYIYKMLEDEIEEGVQLEEGEKPSVLELLNYYLANGDYIFYSAIFADYGECGRDVTSLSDLTEDELAQIEELRQMVKPVKYVGVWKSGGMHGAGAFNTKNEALDYARGCALGNRQAGSTASFEVKTDDIYDPDPTIYSAEISANGKVKYHIKDGKFVG